MVTQSIMCQNVDMSQAEVIGPVEHAVGYVLKRAAAALRSAMDAELRPLDLTVPQYSCLEVLAQRPGVSGAELARATFVSRQSMNLVLAGLQERGLLTRAVVAAHGKALPLELTGSGRAVLRTASSVVAGSRSRCSPRWGRATAIGCATT